MNEKVFTATAYEPAAAAHHIREALFVDGVVLTTTDTVCGLITRAPDSLDRLFELKARPLTMPIAILLTPSHSILSFIVRELPLTRAMFELIPGPLTIVLPRHLVEGMLPLDVATLPWKTYGFRVPYYPPLWTVIESVGGMVFATSANLHGNPSACRIADVEPSIQSGVDAILDGGNCPLGASSTVAVFDGEDWHVTRSLKRIPRLYVEWEKQTGAGGAIAGGAASDESAAPSQDATPNDSEPVVDSDGALFWTEPPLATLAFASRIVYRNTARMSSSQRDMLSALAAWSRAGDVG